MAGDLRNLLARAADDMEAAVAPVTADELRPVRSVVRRRRIGRHAVESAGALAVVGAVATAVLLGGGTRTPEPAESPTPTPSVTSTPTPSPTPTATEEAGPPVRADEIDDATVLARLAAPRTGETWQAPEEVPAPVAGVEDRTWYLVGQRGGVPIYAAYAPADWPEAGSAVRLYEADGTTLRHVECPSARTPDACSTPDPDVPATADRDTFYDTLTPPRAVQLSGGFTLRTAATWTDETVPALSHVPVGEIDDLPPGFGRRVLAELGGGMQVLEISVQQEAGPFLPALRNVRYAVRLPWGGLVSLREADVPGGDSADITWDADAPPAGEDWASRTAAPGGSTCSDWMFSVPSSFDPTAWVVAGRTADGRAVHVPAPGRLELASQVFQHHETYSQALTDGEFLDGADAYPIDSVQQLVGMKALIALEGPDGDWLLGLRREAMAAVYECV